MFSILTLFLNWPVGLVFGILALGAGAFGYFKGLPSLLGILFKPQTWIAIAAIVGVVVFLNAGATIQKQRQEAVVAKAIIKTDKAVITSQNDAIVVTHIIKNKMEHNEQVAKHILQVIGASPEGTQQDAVWDSIIDEENSSGK